MDFTILNPLKWRKQSLETKQSQVRASYISNRRTSTPDFPGFGVSNRYATLFKEAYEKNPIVAASVDLIGQEAASIPINILNDDGTYEDRNTSDVLEFLKRPNYIQTGETFIADLMSRLLVTGDAFVEVVTANRTGAIQELVNIDPDKITVSLNRDGWPGRYTFNGPYGTIEFVNPRDPNARRKILHFQKPSITDVRYGKSPVRAIWSTILTYNETTEFLYSSFKNQLVPSGLLTYEGEGRSDNLSETEREDILRKIKEHYSGSTNAGTPLLLSGGLKWQAIAADGSNDKIILTRQALAREIAFYGWKIPPIILGIPGDSNYSSLQEANRDFWRKAVLPEYENILNYLTLFLAPYFGGVGQMGKLCYLNSDVDALVDEMLARTESIQRSEWMTFNEKRRQQGLPPLEDEAQGKQIPVPARLTLLEALIKEMNQPPPPAGSQPNANR